MSIKEFWAEWRQWGLRVAMHNVLWLYVHRNDRKVRTWPKKR
jgi:hypothetical protein